MNKLLPLLLTAAALLTVLLFGGCADGSSTDSGGEPFSVEEITTEESTAATTRTTALSFTTAAPTESSETVTTTTTKPTVVGKWVLDSTVQDGKVSERDMSEEPPLAYRYELQYEFVKSGKAYRIHPLYDCREEGTWSYGEKGTDRVHAVFPYHPVFNPEEAEEVLCFENGNLFIKAPPAGTDYYFKRVEELPAADASRAAAGKARLAVTGYWECAWINADDTQYTDQYGGVPVTAMKMEIALTGECILHRNNSPEESAAYSLIYIPDGSMEMRLLRAKNRPGNIGQMEGSVQVRNGYLIWRYNDLISYCFRSVTREQFMQSLMSGAAVPEGN